MKIALCDDDFEELDRIATYLNAYKSDASPFGYQTFPNPLELLTALKNSASPYDLIFLDILLPGMTGLRAAQEIRKIDSAVKLIFLSTSREFEASSYAYNPYAYIIKPVSQDRLFSLLDGYLSEKQKELESLTVNTPSGMVKVRFSNLTYVEIAKKAQYFNLGDGDVLQVLSPWSDLEKELLSRPEFLKIHDHFIINLEQVAELRAKDLLTHGGKALPISRSLYGKVREGYMRYLFLDKGVE